MPEEFASFNDPALRTAVRRVWADEQTPFELRSRVLDLVPGQRGVSRPQRHHEPWLLRMSSPLFGLAAAAVVILAFGLAFHDWTSGGRGPQRAPRAIALPDPTAAALFDSHDRWINASHHRIDGSTSGDLTQVGRQLQRQVGFRVLAANLPGSWNFDGAAITKVGNSKSAQLFFDSQNKQFISLISLPAAFVSGSAPGCDYCQSNDKHSMAGFATGNAFYCVVGSSSDSTLTLDQVRQIRDQIRPSMTASAGSAPLAAIFKP